MRVQTSVLILGVTSVFGQLATAGHHLVYARSLSSIVPAIQFSDECEIAPVVLRFDPAFGHPKETFADFTPPIINNLGMILFSGRTISEQGALTRSLILWHDGVGTTIAREGELLPGHPFYWYGSFMGDSSGYELALNDAGMIGFRAHYPHPIYQGRVFIAGYPGELSIVALSHSDHPSAPPDPPYLVSVGEVHHVRVTHSGVLAFAGGPTHIRKIYSGRPGAVELVASPQQQAPGYPDGVTIGRFANFKVSGSGQVYIQGRLSGPGYPSNARAPLWAGPEGYAAPFGSDQPVPGMPAVFTNFIHGTCINSEGIMGIHAFYVLDGTSQPRQALLIGTIDHVFPIIHVGDEVPGVESATVSSFTGAPEITRSGDAPFVAWVNTSEGLKDGVWMWRNGELELRAIRGQPIGNLPGATLASVVHSQDTSISFAANANGELAFRGRISLPDGSTPRALLVSGPSAGLLAVVYPGQQLQFLPGETHVISSVGTPGPSMSGWVFGAAGDDGRGVYLNDHGEFVVRLIFTDGLSGIFKGAIPKTAPCPLDLDGDGFVSLSDLLLLLSAWGPCPTTCQADLNNDGYVNIHDVNIMLQFFGPCP